MTYNKRLQKYFGHLSSLIASDSHEVIFVIGNFVNTDYLKTISCEVHLNINYNIIYDMYTITLCDYITLHTRLHVLIVYGISIQTRFGKN